MKRFSLLLSLFLLTACVTSGGQRITDFSDRSVLYGWLDIEDVDANTLHNVTIYQYLPKTDLPYFNVKVVEFENGFLFYSFAFQIGSFGLDSATGQQCFGLCGTTVYNYDFGKQGDSLGRVRVTEPGIYNLGAFKLSEVKTGLFEQDQFDITPAPNAPDTHKMLEAMLVDTADKPVIEARIKAALLKNAI
jgi:hypothetical protein